MPAPISSVLVHYQEIALKGRNRPWFIARLVRNLREATADLDVREVRSLMGRIELKLGHSARWPEVRERVARVFGIANFSAAHHCPADLGVITREVVAHLPVDAVPSFRVTARRADKRFPVPSPEIEAHVGRAVRAARGWRVDLESPALVIHVEVVTDDAFFFFGKDAGPGGLPTGVSGRVACLLSGGIDSPVAAWRMMKRGCSAQLIHFHSYPILSIASQEKVRELARLLTRYQLRSRLHLVPFGELQQRVVVTVPPELRVVIYRRLMLRIAGELARRLQARALVTGEVVGQVASQTLENLAVIAGATTLPILRPLVGMDKEEITQEAIRLGTYPISIMPDEDCCTLFTPRYPSTRSRPRDVAAAESELPVAEMIQQALDGTVVETFRFPMIRSSIREGAAAPHER